MPRRGYSYKPKSYDEPKKDSGCAVEGCNEAGEFRAPVSRNNVNSYKMLCAEHIKEFNKQWDYFAGMSQNEIENFQKDAFTGHRPTWRPDQRHNESKLRSAFSKFMEEDGEFSMRDIPSIPPKQKRALAVLDLMHPTTQAEIKAQYKKLVKKHHPDVNRDDPKAEDTFKNITEAYQTLKDSYEEVTTES